MNPAVELKKQAETRAGQGDFAGALVLLGKAFVADPQDADIAVQASYVASLNGQYRLARDWIHQSASLVPRNIGVAVERITRLRAFNMEHELRNALNALPPPSRLDIRSLLQLGAQLSYFNQQEQALRYLDEAKRADPQFPPTLLARAQVLMYLGRLDEARRDLLAVETRAPQIPKTYWLRSRIGKATAADNRIERMWTLLKAGGLSADDQVTLAYALHQELDDLGDVDASAAALDMALHVKRAQLNYDARETRALVDALINVDWDLIPAGTVDTGVTPVFIVGPHRSGTTLLETLLDGSDDVLGVGELYDFPSQMRFATDHHCRGPIDRTIVERAPQADFAAVGQGYLDSVQWRLAGQHFFTDKLPTNFFNVGFILKALPKARILHLVRDPIEVAFSNLRESYGDVNAHTYNQVEMAHYLNDYRRLMAFWHRQFPGQVHDVPYRELTQDPAGVMESVATYLGLPLTERMTQTGDGRRAVATASAVQVRSGVSAREVPKWKPYEAYLQPLIEALQ